MDLVIPTEFDEYAAGIERSKLEYVRIGTSCERAAAVTDSKFLGEPYFEIDKAYPTDIDGKPLALLVQINFSEVPALEDFPAEGILQFFIQEGQSEDHVWGMNFYVEEPWNGTDYIKKLQEQKYFRLVYHENVKNDKSTLMTTFPVTAVGSLPIVSECRLSFELDSEFIGPEDYKFKKYLGLTRYELHAKHADLGWQRFDELYEQLGSDAIAKIGGYGRFVQHDPREVAPESEDWLVLLNIESSSKQGQASVAWGDAGVGSFLIRRNDLKARDFSNVVYYWDNH